MYYNKSLSYDDILDILDNAGYESETSIDIEGYDGEELTHSFMCKFEHGYVFDIIFPFDNDILPIEVAVELTGEDEPPEFRIDFVRGIIGSHLDDIHPGEYERIVMDRGSNYMTRILDKIITFITRKHPGAIVTWWPHEDKRKSVYAKIAKRKLGFAVKENKNGSFSINTADRIAKKINGGIVKRYFAGGRITTSTGIDITGAGVDTQLINATPGDFVVNRAAVHGMGHNFFSKVSKGAIPRSVNGGLQQTTQVAVQPGEVVIPAQNAMKFGIGNLMAINRKYGGRDANKPIFDDDIRTAVNGGLLDYRSKSLDMDDVLEVVSSANSSKDFQTLFDNKLFGTKLKFSEPDTPFEKSTLTIPIWYRDTNEEKGRFTTLLKSFQKAKNLGLYKETLSLDSSINHVYRGTRINSNELDKLNFTKRGDYYISNEEIPYTSKNNNLSSWSTDKKTSEIFLNNRPYEKLTDGSSIVGVILRASVAKNKFIMNPKVFDYEDGRASEEETISIDKVIKCSVMLPEHTYNMWKNPDLFDELGNRKPLTIAEMKATQVTWDKIDYSDEYLVQQIKFGMIGHDQLDPDHKYLWDLAYPPNKPNDVKKPSFGSSIGKGLTNAGKGLLTIAKKAKGIKKAARGGLLRTGLAAGASSLVGNLIHPQLGAAVGAKILDPSQPAFTKLLGHGLASGLGAITHPSIGGFLSTSIITNDRKKTSESAKEKKAGDDGDGAIDSEIAKKIYAEIYKIRKNQEKFFKFVKEEFKDTKEKASLTDKEDKFNGLEEQYAQILNALNNLKLGANDRGANDEKKTDWFKWVRRIGGGGLGSGFLYKFRKNIGNLARRGVSGVRGLASRGMTGLRGLATRSMTGIKGLASKTAQSLYSGMRGIGSATKSLGTRLAGTASRIAGGFRANLGTLGSKLSTARSIPRVVKPIAKSTPNVARSIAKKALPKLGVGAGVASGVGVITGGIGVLADAALLSQQLDEMKDINDSELSMLYKRSKSITNVTEANQLVEDTKKVYVRFSGPSSLGSIEGYKVFGEVLLKAYQISNDDRTYVLSQVLSYPKTVPTERIKYIEDLMYTKTLETFDGDINASEDDISNYIWGFISYMDPAIPIGSNPYGTNYEDIAYKVYDSIYYLAEILPKLKALEEVINSAKVSQEAINIIKSKTVDNVYIVIESAYNEGLMLPDEFKTDFEKRWANIKKEIGRIRSNQKAANGGLVQTAFVGGLIQLGTKVLPRVAPIAVRGVKSVGRRGLLNHKVQKMLFSDFKYKDDLSALSNPDFRRFLGEPDEIRQPTFKEDIFLPYTDDKTGYIDYQQFSKDFLTREKERKQLKPDQEKISPYEYRNDISGLFDPKIRRLMGEKPYDYSHASDFDGYIGGDFGEIDYSGMVQDKIFNKFGKLPEQDDIGDNLTLKRLPRLYGKLSSPKLKPTQEKVPLPVPKPDNLGASAELLAILMKQMLEMNNKIDENQQLTAGTLSRVLDNKRDKDTSVPYSMPAGTSPSHSYIENLD